MLEGSAEVWMKDIGYWFIKVNLFLECQEVVNWVWPLMDWIRLLFAQIQAPPPSMHHKWKEIIDIGCKPTSENL